MSHGGQIAYIARLPRCSLHWVLRKVIVPAAYDARIHNGHTWAYMCVACFVTHGSGLGTGKGQRLIEGAPPVEEPEQP